MGIASFFSTAKVSAEHLALKAAVRDLIHDVKFRHPGEDLPSQHHRTLDEMTRPAMKYEKVSWLSRVKPWLFRVEVGAFEKRTYHFFGGRNFLIRGDTFQLGFGWNPEAIEGGWSRVGLEAYFGWWSYCFYRIY